MNSFKDSNSQNYSVTKTYWCHLCKTEFMKLFISGVEVQCRICSNTFCEEIGTNQDSSDHPSTFEPFERINHDSENNPSRNRNTSINNRFSLLNLLLPNLGSSNFMISSNSLFSEEEIHMENIINYLIANDNNRYGNPPASKKALNSLESIEINEEKFLELKSSNLLECSVCKDQFELNQKIKIIPCKHHFHLECIMPWLKERNSCPVCRFELQTDDEDYERLKNQKRNIVRGGLIDRQNSN